MTPRPLMIESTAEVQEAARHMLYAEVRRLFVEEDGVLVRVISQTDMVRAVGAGKLARARVEDLMRHEIVSVEAQESISAAGATMVDTSGPRLPDPDMEPRRADPGASERLVDE